MALAHRPSLQGQPVWDADLPPYLLGLIRSALSVARGLSLGLALFLVRIVGL
ncbi:hypothetical protein LZ32DRAFT_601181, partial [Colletotrichum eremochloae]